MLNVLTTAGKFVGTVIAVSLVAAGLDAGARKVFGKPAREVQADNLEKDMRMFMDDSSKRMDRAITMLGIGLFAVISFVVTLYFI